MPDYPHIPQLEGANQQSSRQLWDRIRAVEALLTKIQTELNTRTAELKTLTNRIQSLEDRVNAA